MADNQELQPWEAYKSMGRAYEYLPPRTQVNVACPKCGQPLWRRNDITLTSYPEQYQYECDGCGWIGYNFH